MAVSGLQVSCSFRLGFRVKALGFGAQGFRAFGFEVQGFGVLALRWALRVHCVGHLTVIVLGVKVKRDPLKRRGGELRAVVFGMVSQGLVCKDVGI